MFDPPDFDVASYAEFDTSTLVRRMSCVGTDAGWLAIVARAELARASDSPALWNSWSPVAAGDPWSFHVSGASLVEELLAAYRAGESPRSVRAQQAVTRFLEAVTALSGTPLTPEVRNRMADGYRQIPDILRQIADEEATSESPVYDDTHGRYLSLVALINGTATEEDHDHIPYAWIADAMRVPSDHTQ